MLQAEIVVADLYARRQTFAASSVKTTVARLLH
jgi:hypothetical protein